MTRAELEKKSLSELHKLAAEAGVERFRMLPRDELIAKLADGDSGGSERPAAEEGERPAAARPPRRRRSRGGRGRGSGGGGESGRGESKRAESGGESKREPRAPREPRPRREPKPQPAPEIEQEPIPEPAPTAPPSTPIASESSSRPRRRRRRRFGRRGKQGVTLQGLLLPPAGRQALLAAETREACTALLRGIAADLSNESDGPDPVALLIDPSPEELADWRRDAPRAEIVAAGQPRHADDALAQARARASSGEDVILLIDSLTRLGEAHGDADVARDFFDAAGGNLTVVAALERPSV